MIETAHILNQATSEASILLDEVGRGTSTADGLSIARAVIEYLHNNPRVAGQDAVCDALSRIDRCGGLFAARPEFPSGC